MFSHSVFSARSPLRLYAVAAPLVLALTLATQASTEGTMIWSERSSGTSTSLTYGSIDAGAGPLFMLSCFNGMSIVVLDVHKEIAGAKPGAPLTIELASAKTTSPVEGEVGENKATGKTFGEASDVEVKPVLAVLSDAGPVTVKMGGTTATLSDQGRDQAVAAFSKNCEVE
jgi:hypothetical protein